MEFQLSYFKSWKMMLWKCCAQNASKFGRLSSGHRTGKGQFSFQSQRKAMPKNAETTATIAHISHASKVMLKILQARLQQYENCELPEDQAGFRKSRGARDHMAHIHWIPKLFLCALPTLMVSMVSLWVKISQHVSLLTILLFWKNIAGSVTLGHCILTACFYF